MNHQENLKNQIACQIFVLMADNKRSFRMQVQTVQQPFRATCDVMSSIQISDLKNRLRIGLQCHRQLDSLNGCPKQKKHNSNFGHSSYISRSRI
jgi:hypothetical protein